MKSFLQYVAVSTMAFFSVMKDLIMNRKSAGSIGIIGGADGPTAIYTTNKLAPHARDGMVAAIGVIALAVAGTAFAFLRINRKGR